MFQKVVFWPRFMGRLAVGVRGVAVVSEWGRGKWHRIVASIVGLVNIPCS